MIHYKQVNCPIENPHRNPISEENEEEGRYNILTGSVQKWGPGEGTVTCKLQFA